MSEIMNNPYFQRWMPVWVHNAAENYEQIKRDFKNRNCDIASLPRPMNKPAIILGSGPSLDEFAPFLSTWSGAIFASTSNAFIPVYYGHDPEYVVAFDSLWELAEHIKNYKWKNSTLITHPNAEPKLIRNWKWNKLYFRRVFKNIEYFEVVLPLMFPMIKLGIVFAGSVVNTAISIANFLGYRPIFLLGVDLGYPNDKAHATYFRADKKGKIIKRPDKFVKDLSEQKRKTMVKHRTGILTDESMLSFKNHLLQIWVNDDVPLINCSNGIITEIPKVHFEQVIKKQGKGFDDMLISKKQKQIIVQDYFKNIGKEFLEE